MMEQPHWLIVAIIGALMGFALNYAPRLVLYIKRVFIKDHMEGNWFEYHWNYQNGEAMLRKEEWIIKRGLNKNLIVMATSRDDGRLSYKGEIYKERDYWLAKFNAIRHDEEIFSRITAPIPSNDYVLVGLWSALDYNGRASVGPQILSRNEITDEEAKTAIPAIYKTIV